MVAMIECSLLSKSFGSLRAVHDLSLEVRRGEVYGFLGLNGAGKTTTVRMLCGLLPPTGGNAKVLGRPVEEQAGMTRQIGVLFSENFAGEPTWSAVRYLRHFGCLHGLPQPALDERIRSLAKILRLESEVEKPLRDLSGGNRRKVELARALIHGPVLLFLDEPTRELDIPAKRAVWGFLRDLVSRGEITIFMSSHDPYEIAELCTRVGVIHRGHLVWQGSSAQLQSRGPDFAEVLADLLEGRHDKRTATGPFRPVGDRRFPT